MKEKITFVVPAHNAEATLERTLNSILNQTDQRYKIVIINDGSTDGTEDICKRYEKTYLDKVTYRYQESKGPGGARNYGMTLVETEYVSFLDSDDWLMPEYVESILTQLERHSEHTVEMVMTLPQIYHEGSGAISEWYDKRLFEEIFHTEGQIINPQEELRVYQFEVNLCRKVLQMDFLREVSFAMREKIKWEDVYPHFYLLSQCKCCMGIGSVGFYYRVGGKGQITASRDRSRLDLLEVIRELQEYIENGNYENLRFPAMRIMVRFSIWGIRMTDGELRKELVRELHRAFKKLPRSYYQALQKGTKNNYSKADARQYQLFILAIRYKICNIIFYDYLYQDIGEKIIKKILGAGQQVA